MQSTMFQTAYLLPSAEALAWGNAAPPSQFLSLPNLELPLSGAANSLFPEICKYALRDRELSYRDLVVAGALAEIALLSGTVFGSHANRLTLPTIPSNVLWAEAVDRGYKNVVVASGTTGIGNGTTAFSETAPVFDSSMVGKSLRIYGLGNFQILQYVTATQLELSGPVTVGVGYSWAVDGAISQIGYVDNSSVPKDALATDKDLYARDVLLYEALARLCYIFAGNLRPINPLDVAAFVNNAWAEAYGENSAREVSVSARLDKYLFTNPDRSLAWRDNLIANQVARINRYLYNVFEHADRLYVRINGVDSREAEAYHVFFNSHVYRMWQAEPFLPGRIMLRYNKLLKTLQWFTEDGTQSMLPSEVVLGITNIEPTNPLILAGTVPGQFIEVIPEVPLVKDSKWCLQKAARVNPNAVAEPVSVYSSNTADLCTTTPLVSQFGAASLTSPGELAFDIPPVSDGNYRLYLHARPSGDILLKGVDNTERASGVAHGVTYPAVGSAYSWYLSLPPLVAPNVWQLTFRYTNLTTSVASMGVAVTWNGNTVSQVCDFGATPGRLMTSVPLVLPAPSTIVGTIKIELTGLGGGGQFHLRDLAITATGDQADYFYFTCKLGSQTKASNIYGKRARADVIEFPFNGVTGSPTKVIFNWSNLNQMTLRLPALELRRIAASTPTSNIPGHTGWRSELLDRAQLSIQDNYTRSQCLYPVKQEFRMVQCTVNETFAYQVRENNPDLLGFTSYNNGVTVTAPTGYYAVGDEIIFYRDGAAPLTSTVTAVQSTDKLTQLTLADNLVVGVTSGTCIKAVLASAFQATGLPNGVSINPLTGYISGIPSPTSVVGVYSIAITVVKAGVPSYAAFTLVVSASAPHAYLWTAEATEAWMNSLEVTETRIRQTCQLGRPGDVGRPGLLPEGLEFTYTGIRANYDSERSVPVIRIFQPWMLDMGIYTVKDDFWSPLLG